MKPNLFHFATSELSQDAFICWLLSWADPKFGPSDASLHRLGLAFLGKLLEMCDVPVPSSVISVEVHKQFKSIDILAIVNGQIAILIEDKTGTIHHSNQLQRYRETISTDFPKHVIAPVYFKTGDQCSYEDVRQAGYACFLRKDFISLLEQGLALDIHDSIFSDFRDYLSEIEVRVTDYRRLPVAEWHWDCWKGFFTELRERLGDGKWDYVANRSGGFMGFWWHWRTNKYLQLESDKLCFKIEVEDKSLQASAWEEWHRILKVESAKAGFPLIRPSRRKNGTWMTVALLQGEYRQRDENGMLDINKTVELLQSAERLLDAAATVKEA